MDTDRYGNKKWYNEEGKLHRDNELPAVFSQKIILVYEM